MSSELTTGLLITAEAVQWATVQGAGAKTASARGRADLPPAGGEGSEYAISALVTLPDDPNLALHFFGGQSGKIGDGVHFVVRVNGREVWRHFRETGPFWEELSTPLGKYAGQTVVLTLGLDAGPAGFHLSCDDTWWGDTELVGE